MYPSLMELGPFYKMFLMGLLVWIHYHFGRCVELVEKMEQILRNPPHISNSRTLTNYFVFVENPLEFTKCHMVIHAFS